MEKVVVIVGFVADARCDLLNLIQLVDDRAPYFLRDSGFYPVQGLVDLTPHLGDVVSLITLVEDGLQLLRSSQSGLDTDLRVLGQQKVFTSRCGVGVGEQLAVLAVVEPCASQIATFRRGRGLR